jgi:hypothetical protein
MYVIVVVAVTKVEVREVQHRSSSRWAEDTCPRAAIGSLDVTVWRDVKTLSGVGLERSAGVERIPNRLE